MDSACIFGCRIFCPKLSLKPSIEDLGDTMAAPQKCRLISIKCSKSKESFGKDNCILNISSDYHSYEDVKFSASSATNKALDLVIEYREYVELQLWEVDLFSKKSLGTARIDGKLKQNYVQFSECGADYRLFWSVGA